MLFVLHPVAHLDHLAPTITTAVFANVMRAHQLAALLAGNQRRRVEALVLAAVAAAMARDFMLWYGTHSISYSLHVERYRRSAAHAHIERQLFIERLYPV